MIAFDANFVSNRRDTSTRGVTLIELVLSIVILGIALGTLVVGVAGETESRGALLERDRAIRLARSMMDEILAAAFEDPDETAGSFGTEEGARSTYDDVDDYDGHSSTPPVDATSTAIPGASGFARSVLVWNVDEALPSQARSDGSTGLKHIRVSVLSPAGETLFLDALRAEGS